MKKLIGDKKFYMMVMAVAVPIMIQNGVTNFVGMLDNIMVGRVGTEEMSGVAIVNQLIFVFNLCIFGAVSGAGIFGAQFYGNKNQEGVKYVLRFKMIACGVLALAAVLIFGVYGESLIALYLHEGSEATGDMTLALISGKKYLDIMLWGMIPFAIVQAYASTLRETGETMLPMRAGVVAVFINLILNYALIFGKFGFPTLSVQGAAIATVISRFVECIYVVVWTHRNQEKHSYIKGLYQEFRIPKKLTGLIFKKGMPLLVNEAFWAGGQAMLMQCYSVRGFEVIGALNISATISNMFNIVFLALGSSVSIIVGQMLGAGEIEEARSTDYKLIFFSVVSCVFVGGFMLLIAPFFPRVYNTTTVVKDLARQFIIVSAIFMPVHAFVNAAYFTLRSGGKTLITFLFDSVFVWMVSIPLAYCLTRFTGVGIVKVYFICQAADIMKCVIGFVMVKKGSWIENIVNI